MAVTPVKILNFAFEELIDVLREQREEMLAISSRCEKFLIVSST